MRTIRLFLCGDVMTGRGVDQILPHPNAPQIFEPAIQDARIYVGLAEEANGPIPRPVDGSYIWGEALSVLDRAAPAARIANLETTVTSSDDYWPKGINYRMHPKNVSCLTAAGIDVCVLANNHMLDYGTAGLIQTIESLRTAGLKTAGAGSDLDEARRPCILDLPHRRLSILSYGTPSSGVFPSSPATPSKPGINFLPDLSEDTAVEIAAEVREYKAAGNLVLVSIHWGSNWGYEIPSAQVRLAHDLIDAGADVIYGHSSHHPRPLEIYKGRLVLYGCGDLIDDYEGITEYTEFRPELRLMYFPTLDVDTGAFAGLDMTPMRMQRMSLTHASPAEARWLAGTLTAVSVGFGTVVEPDAGTNLRLRFQGRFS